MTERRSIVQRLVALCLAGAALAVGAPASAREPALPVWGYEVVRSYPHDREAFTQGLFWRNGFLYESTGMEGQSTVRKVRLETGEVLQRVDLPTDVFGEGIVDWDNRIVGITWLSQTGYVLDLERFSLVGRFGYVGEGWGLTRSEREIVMSDGTAELRFLDPKTLKETRRLKVTAEGRPLDKLNELEWVDGEIFANVWQTDRIARIDPKTGRVTGWIDLAGLLPMLARVAGHTDVLNGIAYDAAAKRLFVTGKRWPRLFEIRLVRKSSGRG